MLAARMKRSEFHLKVPGTYKREFFEQYFY